MSINPFFKAGAMLLMVVVVSGGCGKSSPPSHSTTEPVATEAGQAHHHHDDHDHDHDHDHQPSYREAGFHQHGVAEMTLVLEEGLLNLGLNLPSVDVLGFERAAATEQEQQQLDRAIADLRNPDKVLTLTPEARCELTDALVESALLQPDMPAADHFDFMVYYEFTCRQPEQLSSARAKLFELYPGINKVRFAWIIDARQGLETLLPDQPVIRFSSGQ